MVVEVLVVLLLALAEHFGLKRYSYGLYKYILVFAQHFGLRDIVMAYRVMALYSHGLGLGRTFRPDDPARATQSTMSSVAPF